MNPPPKRRRLPKWLPQVFGYSLSIACLVWVLRDYPLAQIVTEIQGLSWGWVMLGVTTDLATYVAHGWRWNTLLGPVARLRLWRTTQAIYIGLFANEVLPLRTGELIRCYLLAHWNNLRLSVGFASAGVERIFDGFWMVIAFVITATFVKGIDKKLVYLVQGLGTLVIIGAGILLWVVLSKHEAHAVVKESKWSATFRHVVEGLQLMGNPKSLAATAMISLLYLVLQFVTVWALIKAAHFDYSFWVACGLITIVRLAVVVPNAPGNLGVFQAACKLVLVKLFEADEKDAIGFAFVMWFALTLPLLIGGAVATALTGLNLGELREHARRGASAVQTEP